MAAPLPAHPRASALIARLALAPHPEGGWYRECFRSPDPVQPAGARSARPALTSIDFLLCAGEHSAWHRVASDEAWHLLEGGPLRLWLLPPTFDALHGADLAAVDGRCAPRHVVPAGWWQAAEPQADYAYAGATVGPGFDFADFTFGRDDAGFTAALARLAPQLQRLLR